MTAGIVVAVVLLLVAALLRAGIASLLRTTRTQAVVDAAEERMGARRAAVLLEEREMLAPAANMVHALLLVSAAIIASWVIVRTSAQVAVGLVALAAIVVLVGDLLPRAVGRRRPRVLAYRLSGLLAAATHFGSWATDMVDDDDDGEHDADPDDDESESELISSVLEFTETIVREVMVPRTDMVTISGADSIETLLRLFEEHGFSRIPVVGEGPDDVVGLVIVKDLLPVLASRSIPDRVSVVMRPIDFVPETKRIPELLREMQASKSHIAVVVDEYGGTAGIVTIEDLLEELVGEIIDEYDDEELLVSQTAAGVWLVDGRLPVAELSELVGSELPDEEWDTVGGLVLGLAGRVPAEGERLETGVVSLAVVGIQGRRVALVEVSVVKPAVPEEAR
jgi:CBS domain containing-hemolysin-like protein